MVLILSVWFWVGNPKVDSLCAFLLLQIPGYGAPGQEKDWMVISCDVVPILAEISVAESEFFAILYCISCNRWQSGLQRLLP